MTEADHSTETEIEAGAQGAAAAYPLLGRNDAAAGDLGWKAAMLDRLRRAELQTGSPAHIPEGFILDADAAAALASGEETARERLAASLEALGAGASDSLVFRLSPERTLANLAPPPVIALEDGPDRVQQAAKGVAEALAIWTSPRAERRRHAARASERCAILVQRRVASRLLASRVRLYDAETGAPAPSGLIGARGDGMARALTDEAGPGSPDEAVLEAARAAEAALGAPLDCEIGVAEDASGAPEAWILSARPLRASVAAKVRIAVSLANSSRISRDDALLSIDAQSLEELLHATVDPLAPRDRIAHGLPASPGAAQGRLAFTALAAEALAREGDAAILVRPETSPEDVHGVYAAAGVLTTRGGLTSHAAVVARGLGRPCVVGASDARIDLEAEMLTGVDGRVFKAGDWITLDGSTGQALAGRPALRTPEPSGDLATLMGWADARRRMVVRANADTPADAMTAGRLGVDGIGLCRTEHMFVEPERVMVMREMILADGAEERRAALARLLPMQRDDFIQLFEITARDVIGRRDAQGVHGAPPVTIRLLDPPLHEFLPETPEGLAAVAAAMGVPVQKLVDRARELKEFNPMLGKRGCRIGVAYPEIYEMQARAIFEAAIEVASRSGLAPTPEIMIPLVSAVREMEMLKAKIDDVAAAVFAEKGVEIRYGVGLMIETPRAALRAGPLGELSAFFSFGTNDLTQMTFGLSRDDASRLMRDYVERGVFEADPFQTLDQDGVGELIRIAVERGRAANPDLEIGLCGEHGASSETIAFCEEAGFDYVSCSPFRAPIARLAAAQAAIRAGDRR